MLLSQRMALVVTVLSVTPSRTGNRRVPQSKLSKVKSFLSDSLVDRRLFTLLNRHLEGHLG